MWVHTIKHDAADIYIYIYIYMYTSNFLVFFFFLRRSNFLVWNLYMQFIWIESIQLYILCFHFLIIACVFVQGSQTYLDSGFDDKTHHTSFLAMLEALSYTIDRIACEVITNHDYKILPYLYLHQHNNRN